jgi:hypothetical protein
MKELSRPIPDSLALSYVDITTCALSNPVIDLYTNLPTQQNKSLSLLTGFSE